MENIWAESNFPEDFEIQVDRLIQLWVAEGIVFSEEEDGNEGSIAEDLAERYLMELVERLNKKIFSVFFISQMHLRYPQYEGYIEFLYPILCGYNTLKVQIFGHFCPSVKSGMKKMFCSTHGFRKLESLILCVLYNLEEWEVEDGAMPCLRQVEIRACGGLKMFPNGLRYITTLQELKIESMPKMFIDKLVEGGEDFGKVRHVPSRIFKDIFE
ncbi:hypothetical protein V6N13_014058 [Hibiscus sabdariffa]|uniref:Disease resistance protein winged helix domain-containing protein n=1 Tax=Hibiscus sabdariffa TaxID=183260 RepID=A0ABR2RU48_9ROSI